MFGISLSDALAVVGIVAAIILAVLDKTGKLNGPMLPLLLVGAAALTIPLALWNPWVAGAPSAMLRLARGMFMCSAVVMAYSALSIWIFTGGAGKPAFRLSIDGAVFIPIRLVSGTNVRLMVTITNEGRAASIAKGWAIRATLPGQVSEVEGEYLYVMPISPALPPGVSLADKVGNVPLLPNARAEGELAFAFPGVDSAALADKETRLTLSVDDSEGRKYSSTGGLPSGPIKKLLIIPRSDGKQ